MKKTKLIFAASLFLSGLCSCHASIDQKVESQSFTYKYTVNNCTTDEKVLSSNEALCAALKDDALNNYCAQSLRYKRFQSDCPGKNWNP